MAQEPEKNQAATKPKSKKKWIIISIVIVLLLLAAGGVAFYMWMQLQKQSSGHPKEKEVVVETAPVFVPLESFTINLQPYPDEKYLQVSITLQVKDKKDEEDLKSHMPEVRNRIIMLLSNKQPGEITSIEGKNLLTSEIITTLKTPFTNSQNPQNISSVFFTSFIIQ